MCRALKDGLQGPCPVLSSTGPKMMEEGLYMDMPGIQARYARSLAAWITHTLHPCVPRSIYLHLPCSGAHCHKYQALASTPHQGRGLCDTFIEVKPSQPILRHGHCDICNARKRLLFKGLPASPRTGGC